MKILKCNHCKFKNCKCGWNILVGGTDDKELEKLKNFIEKNRK